ncbi:MAG: hypothetical protein RMK18_05195 [Armatimonadota bacterium]|nr:hypothetical protein [Armatimonadota bacterium]MCX7776610.1 hypothetical protein [Armatimonadota bacterium]MDW8025247.1 hypothetical protein [Armatimonadota bacterium]
MGYSSCQGVGRGVNWHKEICVSIFVSMLFVGSLHGQASYEVVDGTPFETRIRGIAGAISVDAAGVRAASQLQWRTQWAIRDAEWRLRRTRPRLVNFLRQVGFWKTDRLGVDMLAVAVEPRRKRILRSDMLAQRLTTSTMFRSRVYGAGKLEFEFVGFRKEVAEALRNWLNNAMPTMIDVYGQPVTSPPGSIRKVRIVLDTTLDALDGGIYSPSTDEIRIGEFEGRKFDYFNLTHLIFHAFRGELVLSYPSWEEGMARAAAIIATRRLIPGFDPSDPYDGDPLFLMPLYDLLNQPPLGNSVFMPPSGYQPMAIWRYGMSAAAWLKVAAEAPNLFRRFNESYYSFYDANASVPLSGDVPALKRIVSQIVQRVEGLDFYDWYRRQHVLDTSVRAGFKLYVFNVPLEIGIIIGINYYRTTPTGDEVPQNAMAKLIYSNDMSDDLYAEEGNEVEVTFGEGFIAPQFFNIGGPNRIRVDISLDGIRKTVYFPYGVRGPENKENPLFGALIGADEGSVSVSSNGMQANAGVKRGVFAVTKGINLDGLRRLTIEHTTTGGTKATEFRNVCFGFYVLLLNAPGSAVTLTKTFKSGWHLMGIPVLPLKSDEAEILGIPREKLLLAHWQPSLIGLSKYEIYPSISTPMHPGIGYWLKLNEDTTISVQGAPTPTDEPFEIPLLGGFNQLANPFTFPIRVSGFRVQYGDGQLMDLQSASQAGLIDPTIWVWTQENGYQAADVIEPWGGFWVRSLKPIGVWLIIPPIGASVGKR